jgi:hypothetical protein
MKSNLLLLTFAVLALTVLLVSVVWAEPDPDPAPDPNPSPFFFGVNRGFRRFGGYGGKFRPFLHLDTPGFDLEPSLRIFTIW